MREYKIHFRDVRANLSEAICGAWPDQSYLAYDDEKVTCLTCKKKIGHSYSEQSMALSYTDTPFCHLNDYQKAIAHDLMTDRMGKKYTIESMGENGGWTRHYGALNMNTLVRIQPYFYMPFSESELEGFNRKTLYIGTTPFSVIGLSFKKGIIIGNIGSDEKDLNPNQSYYARGDLERCYQENGTLRYPWLVVSPKELLDFGVWQGGKPIGHKIPSDKFKEAWHLWSSQQDERMKTLAEDS
jgi:hypothetical protein